MIDLPSGYVKETADTVRKGATYGVFTYRIQAITSNSSGLNEEAREILRRLNGYNEDALEVSRTEIADEILKFEKLADGEEKE